MQMNRRQAVKHISLGSAAALVAPYLVRGAEPASPAPGGVAATYPFQLPALPYAFNALEGCIDAETMEIHHDRHHAGYVSKLNSALEAEPDYQDWTLPALLAGIETLPESIKTSVRNNGGGHANHTLFWSILSPASGGTPSGDLGNLIGKHFGSLDACKAELKKTCLSVFGSGWAWLVLEDRSLAVLATPNQDSPHMSGQVPLLGIDVWEHAYYLRYQNRRADYIDALLNHINWNAVAGGLPQA